MQTDTIIDEIHEARAQLLRQHGGDFAAYFAALVKKQEQHPALYASFVQPTATVAPILVRPPAG